ncbi:MAG TPA: hypothetical protein VF054_05330 [Micromonosporaceae bacterium]
MKARWQPVAILTAVLFIVNAIARFLVWQGGADSERSQTRIGLVAMAVVAVVLVGAGYWWARRHPVPRVLADLAVAAILGDLLSVVVGPFAGGSVPFKEGAAFVYSEIWHYLGLAAIGVALGIMVAIAAGQDWKSQALKRYAETARSKPRRVVRR